MQPRPRIRVYTDGRCGLCARSRRFVEQFDRQCAVDFRDYNDPAVARETPYADAELAREMHAESGGHWFAGYWAWIEVLRVLPKWRWLARVAQWPPFRWLGPRFYRLFAANRYRIADWLGWNETVCAVAPKTA